MALVSGPTLWPTVLNITVADPGFPGGLYQPQELKSWGRLPIIMVRKRRLGQSNIFKSVCHSASRGRGLPIGESTCGGGQTL